jgi:hypothetical protein
MNDDALRADLEALAATEQQLAAREELAEARAAYDKVAAKVKEDLAPTAGQAAAIRRLRKATEEFPAPAPVPPRFRKVTSAEVFDNKGQAQVCGISFSPGRVTLYLELLGRNTTLSVDLPPGTAETLDLVQQVVDGARACRAQRLEDIGNSRPRSAERRTR